MNHVFYITCACSDTFIESRNVRSLAVLVSRFTYYSTAILWYYGITEISPNPLLNSVCLFVIYVITLHANMQYKNCFVFVYMFSVLLGGVALYNSGWGYYSNNHYILCVFRN